MALDKPNGYESFKSIANIVFQGGKITWGTIVTLYALESAIVVELTKYGSEKAVLQFATFAGEYIGEKVEDWIKKIGGWVNILPKLLLLLKLFFFILLLLCANKFCYRMCCAPLITAKTKHVGKY